MKVLILYFAIINIITFFLYGIDKSRARRDAWRISEFTLIGCAALGGALGAFLGMHLFHHKTKKLKFRILIPIFLIIWGIIFYRTYKADAELDALKSYVEPQTSETVTEKSGKDSFAPIETESQLTLVFAGDINLDDNWCVMQNYYAGGEDLSKVIDSNYLSEMQNADIFWVNNEFTFSDRGTPTENKAYTFRSKPENVKLLKEMGADIVGLANNHIYDYGKDAFLDTLDTLDTAGILYVGAGKNLDEAKAPVYIEKDGITIAYVAASRAEKIKLTPQATETEPGILRCYDNSLFVESIKEARQNADYVIALPHWGTEYATTLEEAQINGAKEYIDAGADIVIGAHTHCVQGIGSYNEKPIVYSLGNFWFNEKSLETMLVKVTLTVSQTTDEKGNITSTIKDSQFEILPGMQQNCTTAPAETEEKRKELTDYIYSLPN